MQFVRERSMRSFFELTTGIQLLEKLNTVKSPSLCRQINWGSTEMMCARGMDAVRLRLPYAPANGQLRFRVLLSVGASDRHLGTHTMRG